MGAHCPLCGLDRDGAGWTGCNQPHAQRNVIPFPQRAIQPSTLPGFDVVTDPDCPPGVMYLMHPPVHMPPFPGWTPDWATAAPDESVIAQVLEFGTLTRSDRARIGRMVTVDL